MFCDINVNGNVNFKTQVALINDFFKLCLPWIQAYIYPSDRKFHCLPVTVNMFSKSLKLAFKEIEPILTAICDVYCGLSQMARLFLKHYLDFINTLCFSI